MKLWDDDSKTDVVRFVLRRGEWNTLIEALASSCTRNDKAWQGLDVLRNAEIDVNASAMVKALMQIQDYADSKSLSEIRCQLIRDVATRGLKDGAPEAKEEEQSNAA